MIAVPNAMAATVVAMCLSQPPLSQPTNHGRSEQEAQQVTAGWSHHIGQTNPALRRSSENRQAQRSFGKIEQDRRSSQTPTEGHAHHKHHKGLHRDRHRVEWDLDLGRQPKRKAAHHREKEKFQPRISALFPGNEGSIE